MTKLSSSLPKGVANGLGALARHIIEDPAAGRIIIAVVDCKSITTDMDSGDVQPTARIEDPRVELVAEGLHNHGGCEETWPRCSVSTVESYRNDARDLLARLDAVRSDHA